MLQILFFLLVFYFIFRNPKPRTLPKWLDKVLKNKIPQEVAAFCFNIYEGGKRKWSIELVGTDQFNTNNEDWACSEITNFGTRKEPFTLKNSADYKTVFEEIKISLNEYLSKGKRAEVLKSKKAVAVGFVDGDLEILYTNSTN